MMDIPACIARLTGKDAKDACAYTSRIVEESRGSARWFPCLEAVAALLEHKNSLVRNRAIAILAANARWDREGKLDALMDEFLRHVTDEKPITARQCIQALPEIAAAKPHLIARMRAALEGADLSAYRSSMRPLILKDIAATLDAMEGMQQ